MTESPIYYGAHALNAIAAGELPGREVVAALSASALTVDVEAIQANPVSALQARAADLSAVLRMDSGKRFRIDIRELDDAEADPLATQETFYAPREPVPARESGLPGEQRYTYQRLFSRLAVVVSTRPWTGRCWWTRTWPILARETRVTARCGTEPRPFCGPFDGGPPAAPLEAQATRRLPCLDAQGGALESAV